MTRREAEVGLRTHQGPQSLPHAPRCVQRPHGGATAPSALRFGASAAQGWRAYLEDAHCAWLPLPDSPPGWAFFAVTDGHGGRRAAPHGARRLPGHVLEALGPEPGEPEGECAALRNPFPGAQARLRALRPRGQPGGSTAVALLASPRFLYPAHGPEPRWSGGFSTEDHRPSGQRIRDAGGTIRRGRLEGSLAVSRALGLCAYKGGPGRPPELQLVSAEPEVTALASQAEDESMLLASDGPWDAMSGAALARLVTSRLSLGLAPELFCARLLDTCLQRQLNNVTCTLVCFPGVPRPWEETIRKELALDTARGRRVAGEYAPEEQGNAGGKQRLPHDPCLPLRALCLCPDTPQPEHSFQALASEEIPTLPPGGGLYCKATVVVTDAYSQFYQTSGVHWDDPCALECLL
ncbi:putative protein phosphatase 1N [Galemys pyrenaicus]|uniref:protein-serine/threonine phosphatase n=1 Tax=Galemys pyrenaicus TaxID=202257 RepID=A0A8J6A4K4_GALPY|nr:putative protein phosphatase 1N [Galemys pyrenaicus]